MADIYFATVDRSEVYRLPILPAEMPELNVSSKNEEFETFDNGAYNLIGDRGLITFELSGILPAYANKYNWAKCQINPYDLINLWGGAMLYKYPIRCIMERSAGDEILNWLVTIESMKWNEDKVKDIKYSISCKEYREVE